MFELGVLLTYPTRMKQEKHHKSRRDRVDGLSS